MRFHHKQRTDPCLPYWTIESADPITRAYLLAHGYRLITCEDCGFTRLLRGEQECSCEDRYAVYLAAQKQNPHSVLTRRKKPKRRAA